MPVALRMWPEYCISFEKKLHLLFFIERFADLSSVTVIAQLPTHSFGMLQNQPKHRSLSNPLENQLAVG